MQRWLGIFVLLAHIPAMSGCSFLGPKRQLDYRTVQSDPHHDSDRAKIENARAIKLLEGGKLDKAETALQKSLLADVTFGPAHNNLGKVYYIQRKFYLAAWEFEYANKLMPHRPECQNNLGMVYEAVGKLDDAIDSYSVAYALDQENPVVIGNLARARLRRGDDDPVIRQLLADLKLYDSRPDWVSWASEELTFGSRAVTGTSSDADRTPIKLPSADAPDRSIPEPLPLPEPSLTSRASTPAMSGTAPSSRRRTAANGASTY